MIALPGNISVFHEIAFDSSPRVLPFRYHYSARNADRRGQRQACDHISIAQEVNSAAHSMRYLESVAANSLRSIRLKSTVRFVPIPALTPPLQPESS